MGHDVHVTGSTVSICERIPVLVFSHHAWCVAYVGVCIARQIDGFGGWVVNLQIFVVGAAFCSLGEEEVVALRQAEEAIRVKQASTRE